MKLTYYKLAGYINQIDYETSTEKTGYDPKMINKIALGKINRNNRYLIPDMYVDLLTNKLEFINKHDLLWGNTEEIKQYASKLFECLLKDCIEKNVKIKSNILSLISNFGRGSTEVTPEKVATLLEISFDDLGTVEDQFVRLFTDFTYNKYNSTNQVENEGVGVLEFNIETKLVTSFNDAEYLTFKKLPQSIELFVANVFFTICYVNIFI
ncbi:hypothetical protein [Listeria monocytogenes]|uniref:hypothetical protein n=1 Tax=Listeria monocytogenes TaxID=1639 RepID=UPI00190F8E96|nr:hypothetical protein [Listeria monocytogenes]